MAVVLIGIAGIARAQNPPGKLAGSIIETTRAAPRPGDSPHEHPASARRIVHLFDFEEPDNPHPVPRFWVKAQDDPALPRPGFPSYNEAGFDFEVAASGRASVRLPTRGGSTCLRLGGGALPIFPSGDYTVSAKVRTGGLRNARAFLSAAFLDQSLHPIAGGVFRTRPILAEGAWTAVSVELRGIFPTAAFLRIDLELLQPRQFLSAPALGIMEAPREDIVGAAWFDDVQMSQSPRIEISTGSPANIVYRPELPVLHILVRDMVNESLTARVTVTDLEDRAVSRTTLPVGGFGSPILWTPALPALGWYQATLEVSSGGERVGSASTAFLWCEPRPGAEDPEHPAQAPAPGAERARFGLIADTADGAELAALPGIVAALGTGHVTLSIWDSPVPPDSSQAAMSARWPVLDALMSLNQTITLTVPAQPDQTTPASPPNPRAPAISDAGPERVFARLGPALDRYGQRITRWQIGRTNADDAPATGIPAERIAEYRSRIGAVAPAPLISLPWRAEAEFPVSPASPAPDCVTVTVPVSFPLRALERLLADSRSRTPGVEMTLVPETLPEQPFGRSAAVTELALRTIELWRLAADAAPGQPETRFALDHPWRWEGDLNGQVVPGPQLLAWRTLAEHLADRRISGEFPADDGIRCLILAPSGSDPLRPGALVAWSESGSEAAAPLRAFLGNDPITAVDLFGNQSAVERSEEPGRPHTVLIGPAPVFIEGADANLALFVSSFRLEPTFLVAAAAPHPISVLLRNPWAHAVTGRVQLLLPGSGRSAWTANPGGATGFVLEPGATKRIPFTLTFPANEPAGTRGIVAVVLLDHDPPLPALRLQASVEVGLEDIEMQTECRLSPDADGPDVVVIAVLTNRGRRPLDLQLEAAAPGAPTRQVPINDLAPGASITKRLVYKDAAKLFAGKRLRLSVAGTDYTGTLTKLVRVP